MPKAQDYDLTDEELQQVEKAIKHDKRAEVVQRSIALRLLHLAEALQYRSKLIHSII